MASVFDTWIEQDRDKPFPDHLLGMSVSLAHGGFLEARARPSHIKLVPDDDELRMKVYGGIDFVAISAG